MNENEKCVTGTQEVTAKFEYNGSPRIVEAYGKTYELPKKTVSFLDKILTVGREIVYCKNTSAVVQKLKQGIAYFIGEDETERIFPAEQENTLDANELAQFWIFLNRELNQNLSVPLCSVVSSRSSAEHLGVK